MMRDRRNLLKGKVLKLGVGCCVVVAALDVVAIHAASIFQEQVVSSKNRQTLKESIYMGFFMLP